MILVYRYGLAAPHEQSDKIFDQMLLAHRYRNTLVEIERGRRAAERELMADVNAELLILTSQATTAEAEVARLYADLKKERARTHKRSEGADLKAALVVAKEAKTATTNKLRQARKDIRESSRYIIARDLLSERAGELVRGARALSGLASRGPHFGAWGTYQLAEEAAQASFSTTPLYGPDGLSVSDPSFVRWTGSGAVSVQIQKGCLVSEALSGENTQIRIGAPDEKAWLNMPGNGRSAMRKAARHGALTLCLGSDVEGNRIYGRWRLDMHRPLPEGGRIKRATVRRRMSGPFAHWNLELTVEAPDRATSSPTKGGTIAIDLGWRTLPAGLRVAGWADTHGETGEVDLDPNLIRMLREPQEIRSSRDSLFDLEILRVARFVEVATIPDWLRVATASLRQWKAAGRLARLASDWAERRFVGDKIAFDSLEAWARADRGYWAQETRRRDASLRRRRDNYLVFAARIAKTYSTIVLEQFDLRIFAKRSGEVENETARSNRHLAAPSELRLAVINAARARGRTVVAVPAHDTTRTCPACGLVEKRDAAISVTLACECGAVWDQDTEGAAMLLLRRWREQPSDAKTLAGARDLEKSNETGEKQESRRDRVRRMRKEKEVRMATAREVEASSAK